MVFGLSGKNGRCAVSPVMAAPKSESVSVKILNMAGILVKDFMKRIEVAKQKAAQVGYKASMFSSAARSDP